MNEDLDTRTVEELLAAAAERFRHGLEALTDLIESTTFGHRPHEEG